MTDLERENRIFYEKANESFRHLFQLAKAKNELHFALSLMPEFRGMRAAGWNTTEDTHIAFQEYLDFLKKYPDSGFRARVAIGFYCHLAEASGFYEIPKNMLRVIDGKRYSILPFHDLVEKHKLTGNAIAPNANKLIRNLVGHSKELGLDELAEVFRDAFDSDLRNGYAHADYVIWSDGIRLPKRNGGNAETIHWPKFDALFERAINFFQLLREIVNENVKSYSSPKKIHGQLAGEPAGVWTIHADVDKKSFSISSG